MEQKKVENGEEKQKRVRRAPKKKVCAFCVEKAEDRKSVV